MSTSAESVEASTVHIRTTKFGVVPREEVTRSLEHTSMDYLAERKNPLRALYVYGTIFLIMNLCAWFVRDYGQLVLPQLHYLKSCGTGGSGCFHTLGVLRLSLGCFVSFSWFCVLVLLCFVDLRYHYSSSASSLRCSIYKQSQDSVGILNFGSTILNAYDWIMMEPW